MNEFKGTPGPWSVNEKGQHWNNKSLTHLEVIFGEDGECICDTVYQREDANLIAAAPELLEALLDLEGRACIYVNTSEAKAAIAKAPGESQ
ncbi:MAG: hypothetical protein ACM685_07775 [Enterobacteriaceae bacterium]